MASSDRIEREKKQLHQQRQDLILGEAEKIFLLKGLSRTTISDIAESCELTNGALYLYFVNKREIILVAVTRILSRFADLIRQEQALGGTGFEMISRMLDVYNQTFRKSYKYHALFAQFNLLFNSDYPDSEYLSDYIGVEQKILGSFITAFESGTRDKSIKKPEDINGLAIPEVARMFLNVINSFVEKLSLRKNILSPEEQMRLDKELSCFIDYLIKSLRP